MKKAVENGHSSKDNGTDLNGENRFDEDDSEATTDADDAPLEL